MEQRDGDPAHSVAAELHGGDVDPAAPQGHPDIPDHPGSIIIMDQQNMPLWNGFDQAVIESDNSKLLPSEEGPCDVILFHFRFRRDRDEAGEVLRTLDR